MDVEVTGTAHPDSRAPYAEKVRAAPAAVARKEDEEADAETSAPDSDGDDSTAFESSYESFDPSTAQDAGAATPTHAPQGDSSRTDNVLASLQPQPGMKRKIQFSSPEDAPHHKAKKRSRKNKKKK